MAASDVRERAARIRLAIFDVDGVMTDGRVIINDQGVETRFFDIKDGFGVVALQQSGIEAAIISTKQSESVARRAKELRIEMLYMGVRKKLEKYEEILREKGLTDAEVCYVGDDLVDLPLMKRVGLAVAVADAVDEVKAHAHYVTDRKGGKGAVREACELILKAQEKWDRVVGMFEG